MTSPRRVRASHDETTMDEASALAAAVRLALANAEARQLPFGALVLRDGAVLGTGVNTALRDHDPLAHAEVAAIRDACRAVGAVHLTGAAVVSSCEPCALCHAAAVTAGVGRLVYAATRTAVPDLGYPAPADPTGLAARMQAALRAAAPEQLVHVPTPGAEEPFARFLALGDLPGSSQGPA